MTSKKASVVLQDDDVIFAEFSAFEDQIRQQLLASVKHTEKKVFPRTEAFDFDAELKKKNTFLYCTVHQAGGIAHRTVSLIGYLVCVRMKRVTLLHKVCVREQFRRRGNAKAMLAQLEQEVRKQSCNEIQLWVDEEREPARYLYASCDYEEVDRVENYYGPGRTGLKMVRKIQQD
ncbi:MAG: hypothetical protein M1819_001982 [Sarea resinae]|nr:MAG: hypothetical protein M1819_001982 [Sarea resinae]